MMTPDLKRSRRSVEWSRRELLRAGASSAGLAVVPFAWVGLAPAKTNAPGSKQAGCGIERWSVKTLADPAGRALSLSPKATTIRALRRKQVPAYLGLRRGRGVARTTFRVSAKLVEMKLALGEFLRRRRVKRRLTQQALAQKLGSSQSRIAKLESAVRGVTLDLLFRALFAAGISTGEIARELRPRRRSAA